MVVMALTLCLETLPLPEAVVVGIMMDLMAKLVVPAAVVGKMPLRVVVEQLAEKMAVRVAISPAAVEAAPVRQGQIVVRRHPR